MPTQKNNLPEPNVTGEAGERFEKIESHLAHLEHTVDQLNEVIIAQGKDIKRLKLLISKQAQTMESIELERIKATNSKPPHYQ